MKHFLFAVLAMFSMTSFAGGFLGDEGAGGRNKDLADMQYTQLWAGSYMPANTLQANLKVLSTMTVRNTLGYELIGIYSGATATRDSTALHQDVTGISGVAFKDSTTANATGMECDVFNLKVGGTSRCMRIKFTLSNPGDIGVRMEPPSYASDLIGISFADNAHAYKYTVDHAGAPVSMGVKNGVRYCIQFNEVTTDLEYIKNCGTDSEQVIGRITITPIVTKGK